MKKLMLTLVMVLSFSAGAFASSHVERYNGGILLRDSADGFSMHMSGHCRTSKKPVVAAPGPVRARLAAMAVGDILFCDGEFDFYDTQIAIRELRFCRPALEAESETTYPYCREAAR